MATQEQNGRRSRKSSFVTKISLGLFLAVLTLMLSTHLYGKWDRKNRNFATKILRVELYIMISVSAFLFCRYSWLKSRILFKDGGSLAKVFQSVLLVVMIGAQLCFVVCFFLLTAAEPHILSIMCALSFVAVLLFFLLLVSSDAVMFIVRHVFPFNSEWKRMEIKLRLSLLMMVSATLTLYGYHKTTPIIHRVDINVQGFPKSLEGFNIVQISDIHIGPTVGTSDLKWIVDQINSLEPDLVVITGDLVDSPIEKISAAVQPLSSIRSRNGVYFAPGNHDYYSGDIDEWTPLLKGLGVTSLMNERVFIGPTDNQDHGEGFYLAGLEDWSTKQLDLSAHTMDTKKALAGRKEGVPTIVLAHQPSAAKEVIHWRDVNLVLCGHTHAGQFFPYNILVYLVNPFFVGLYEPKEGVFVYVSPGTKYFLFPVRHFYDPEITNLFIHST